jgi:uncharacterized protein
LQALIFFKSVKGYLIKHLEMECRKGCAACCIALSISSPIPGLPDGKPAGIRCIHLLDNYKCAIYSSIEKPKVCDDFKAEPQFCGENSEEAMNILSSLSK